MSTDIEDVLRRTLTDEARALDVAADPYPGFARRERSHVRNRRLRTAGLAGLTAAALGLATGVVALPGWVPGATAEHAARLAHGPTRGPLAADEKFLAEFREHLDDRAEEEGLWRVDRDAADIVWAGDVPGARIVVADVAYRLMGVTSWSLQTFEGAPGAPGGQMEPTGDNGSDNGDVVTVSMTSDAGPGYAFALGPVGSTVELGTGFTYGADGRVHRPAPAAVGRDGLATLALPAVPLGSAEGTVFATITAADGRRLFDGPVSGGGASEDGSAVDRSRPEYADPARGLTDAMVTAALGARHFDTGRLRMAITWSLRQSGLTASEVRLAVPWTGSIAGQPAVMWTLQPTGGGVLTFLAHGDVSRSQDGSVLQPAADAGIRPLGWRLRGETNERRTDRVVVIAPGAASAAVDVAGRAPVPVPLDADGFGMATVPPDAAAHVTATRPDGRTLRTVIPPFESTVGGLPGLSPSTSLVE